MKLIQGVFFQPTSGVCPRFFPDFVKLEIIKTGLHPFMFAGVIFEEDGELKGMLRDLDAEWLDCDSSSILSEITITNEVVRFTKVYDNGSGSPIKHVFGTRADNIWFGGYLCQDGMKGTSWCVITDINDEVYFFEWIERLVPFR